jgi:hypothetical protein
MLHFPSCLLHWIYSFFDLVVLLPFVLLVDAVVVEAANVAVVVAEVLVVLVFEVFGLIE